jgi:hypothetical protein
VPSQADPPFGLHDHNSVSDHQDDVDFAGSTAPRFVAELDFETWEQFTHCLNRCSTPQLYNEPTFWQRAGECPVARRGHEYDWPRPSARRSVSCRRPFLDQVNCVWSQRSGQHLNVLHGFRGH